MSNCVSTPGRGGGGNGFKKMSGFMTPNIELFDPINSNVLKFIGYKTSKKLS